MKNIGCRIQFRVAIDALGQFPISPPHSSQTSAASEPSQKRGRFGKSIDRSSPLLFPFLCAYYLLKIENDEWRT